MSYFDRHTDLGNKWLKLPSDQRALYNRWDLVATALAATELRQEMVDQRMEQFWDQQLWPLIPPVMAMQERGLPVDREALNSYRTSLTAELHKLDQGILQYDTNGTLKGKKEGENGLNSPQKVAKFLFEDLGLKPQKKTKSGAGWSADQEALMRVWRDLRKKDEHARPVLEDLFHRSRLKTILTRYLKVYTYPDGRARPTIKLQGTETGRFAYQDPPLQQLPPECRFIYTPPEGCVYVGADYEQLEARITAYLAGEDVDIEVFESGADLHAVTAQEVFGYSDADWLALDATQRKGMRNYAKAFRYRLAYGGDPSQVGQLGSKTFCPCPRCAHLVPPTVNLPAGTITRASQRFLGNRPALEKWRDELLASARRTRSTTNPLGLKRFWFGPESGYRRELYNWPIQSTAAAVINRAMVEGHHRWEMPFFLQMHDYLGLEVPEAEAGLWGDRLREVMEAEVPELGVSLPVEMKIERPWGVELKAA